MNMHIFNITDISQLIIIIIIKIKFNRNIKKNENKTSKASIHSN